MIKIEAIVFSNTDPYAIVFAKDFKTGANIRHIRLGITNCIMDTVNHPNVEGYLQD
jgi:hypothetical protein